MRTIIIAITLIWTSFAVAQTQQAQISESTQRIDSPVMSVAASSIDGEWYGVIEGYENYTLLEPRRKLVVTGEGCTWQEIDKNTIPVPCTVTAKRLELRMADRSRAVLMLRDDGLVGTFTLADGKTVFRLAMMRSISPKIGWDASVVAQTSIAPVTKYPRVPTAPEMASSKVLELCFLYFSNAVYEGDVVELDAAGKPMASTAMYYKHSFKTQGKMLFGATLERHLCEVFNGWRDQQERGASDIRVYFDGRTLIWVKIEEPHRPTLFTPRIASDGKIELSFEKYFMSYGKEARSRGTLRRIQ